MNHVNMNIGIIKYIFYLKHIVISIDLITWFNDPHDYEYWNYETYFKFTI